MEPAPAPGGQSPAGRRRRQTPRPYERRPTRQSAFTTFDCARTERRFDLEDSIRMTRYFDYNATTPARPEVIAAVAQAMGPDVGNPSSMHGAGRRARAFIDDARVALARLLGADAGQVIFTSGATEANNLALRGFAATHPDGAIVTTEIDHASILSTADALEVSGYCVERLAVATNARPDLARIRELTAKRPCLVATSWANGESGHVADVDALAASVAPGSLLHLDAAQAVGRIGVRMDARVGSLALSAHKFGGPRGAGALVTGRGTSDIAPILTGGPQENGRRAGTENLAGIVGLGVAADCAARDMASEASRLRPLRERLWATLSAEIADALRISPGDGLPNTLTIALVRPTSDVAVAALDLQGFCVSAGAACAAGAPEPSHVVKGLGIAPEYRAGLVRISMGRDTTAADVDELAAAFLRVVARARRAA
jgi:cysteine desulfurase